MLTSEMEEILSAWKRAGWIPEPDAKKLFSLAGFDVPRFTWAKTPEEACRFAGDIGYPVVAKIVSPRFALTDIHRAVEVMGQAERNKVIINP